MNSDFYLENALPVGLVPFLEFFPDGHRFIQDNDPKHRSKRTHAFHMGFYMTIWYVKYCDQIMSTVYVIKILGILVPAWIVFVLAQTSENDLLYSRENCSILHLHVQTYTCALS